MSFSENAIVVLKSRYLKKNELGEVIETPDEMLKRVSKHIAQQEKDFDYWYEKFYELMASLKFLPNTPTLVNAGNPLGQLSACFVLPVGDSMEEIFEAVKQTAIIHKTGGGTGFSFSRLRPKGEVVQSTKGVASGPVSFMRVFDCATESVKQGGVRRGANMGILRVDHPDIMEFIHCKEQENAITNFNISIAITDDFLEKLKNDEEYKLINPRTKQVALKLKASLVWDEIAQSAWRNGEPGLVFIDRINKLHTLKYADIESTNPCGEQPLLPYESCNLGSINLSKFTRDGEIDFDDLKVCVHTAVRFLDNVIDVNNYPIEQIKNETLKNRKIGLGIMGFADMLIDLNVAYNSPQGIEIATKVMSFIQNESHIASSNLAKERGCFETYDKSIFKEQNMLMRNATTTTIAPTGTISMIADCSSGIEPYFTLAYYKQVLDGKKLKYVNDRLLERLKALGADAESILEEIIANGGKLKGLNLPKSLSGLDKVFVTSMDMDYTAHIDMQAAFQAYTDNAVSKTINMPNSATIDDVKQAYIYSIEKGLKGLTVYRDGSRSVQVLVSQSSKSQPQSIKRGNVLKGITEKLKTSRGSLYVTVNTLNDKPVEVFANIGKSGGDISALSEAIGRLISIALQNGVDVEKIVGTLINITGAQPIWNEGRLIKSVPDAIAQVLKDHFLGKKIEKNYEECPECGGVLEEVEGCAVCKNCGYSRCS
ncbi:MAG: vitamin B12-dependent ribonucleotide reductase [Desulfurella sp.]|uniref:vitamin B12-dependent ribonucleotide reductase n=1 Tax=Desulfurella sp. TaxID=1962857 RepID=UPI003CB4DEC6